MPRYIQFTPVNRYDPSGYFWKELAENALKAALVCAVVAVVAAATVFTGGAALAVVGGGVLASALTATASATMATAIGLTVVAAGSAAMEHASQSFRYAKPEPMTPKGSKSKNHKAPLNNQAQNDQFKAVCKELKITDKDKIRQLHNAITGGGHSYSEIRGIAISLFF